MRADRKFTDAAIEVFRAAVDDADGNEVFAAGYLNDAGLIDRVIVTARGNESAVLALASFWQDADVLIHNHPSGRLAPSEADLSIAARAGEGGLGFFIVDNAVDRVYVVAEPTRKRVKNLLDVEELAAGLSSGGTLASRLEVYENRPAQLDLLKKIARAFNRDAILAAEAGTGVGKSFAYLVPAVAWAEANEERVVVSTATINLQQQLFEKDIPLVLRASDSKIKAVLMKGRGNYLCLRRLLDAVRERELFPEENEQLDSIIAWAETTENGSRTELPFMVEDSLWTRVCSEADTCMGLRCPERDRCFVLSLRKQAAEARLLVVNHHLLFADLAARASGAGYDSTVVLPPYTRVILDEAHNIEESATSFFSGDFNRLTANKQLNRLYRRRRGLEMGLVPAVSALCGNLDRVEDIAEAVQKVKEALDGVDTAGVTLTDKTGNFRLTLPRDPLLDSFLFEPLSAARIAVARLAGLVRDLVESSPDDAADDPSIWEIKAVVRRLESVGDLCGRFTEYEERPEEIFWIERKRTSKGEVYARFIATPLDISASLREALYEPNKTIICVSATLTVADSFQYWLRRIGVADLADREIDTGLFPSPFPYRTAVLLAVPTDGPLPEEGGYQRFVDTLVARLTMAAGGSALILFTSYESLRSSYAIARPQLEASGIVCLKQGDDDRSRLLKRFVEDRTSVLFATDSFWEGVDAPGDTLRLVVLCRLPFRSPNDPVYEARREALERRGGNAFMELSLPEAVMKFKQGFGRLMRRGSDRGAVVVLDGRLLRKRYGDLFVRSLPETRRSFVEAESLASSVDRFLAE